MNKNKWYRKCTSGCKGWCTLRRFYLMEQHSMLKRLCSISWKSVLDDCVRGALKYDHW